MLLQSDEKQQSQQLMWYTVRAVRPLYGVFCRVRELYGKRLTMLDIDRDFEIVLFIA